jgi:hypothetical protein
MLQYCLHRKVAEKSIRNDCRDRNISKQRRRRPMTPAPYEETRYNQDEVKKKSWQDASQRCAARRGNPSRRYEKQIQAANPTERKAEITSISGSMCPFDLR